MPTSQSITLPTPKKSLMIASPTKVPTISAEFMPKNSAEAVNTSCAVFAAKAVDLSTMALATIGK